MNNKIVFNKNMITSSNNAALSRAIETFEIHAQATNPNAVLIKKRFDQ